MRGIIVCTKTIAPTAYVYNSNKKTTDNATLQRASATDSFTKSPIYAIAPNRIVCLRTMTEDLGIAARNLDGTIGL